MLDDKNNVIMVKNLTKEEELEISIPKTIGKEGNNTLPGGMIGEGTYLGCKIECLFLC